MLYLFYASIADSIMLSVSRLRIGLILVIVYVYVAWVFLSCHDHRQQIIVYMLELCGEFKE